MLMVLHQSLIEFVILKININFYLAPNLDIPLGIFILCRDFSLTHQIMLGRLTSVLILQ